MVKLSVVKVASGKGRHAKGDTLLHTHSLLTVEGEDPPDDAQVHYRQHGNYDDGSQRGGGDVVEQGTQYCQR